MKKRNIIFTCCLILLAGIICFLLINNRHNRSRLYELNVNNVIDKLDNNESFILCISQSTCTHCNNYKPKLEKISTDYEIDIYYIDINKYDKKERELFTSRVSFDGSTPVTVFIKNGEEATTSNRIYGDLSTDKVINKFIKNGFIDKEK